MLLKCVLVALALGPLALAQLEFEDVSKERHIFESNKLLVDDQGNFLPRFMPSVGNGHLATTPRTSWIYMNGLYNGLKGESHRAKIPSKWNRPIKTDGLVVVPGSESYGLNVQDGYYYEKMSLEMTVTGKVAVVPVEVRQFAHREYHRVLVTQYVVHAPEGQEITLTLDNPWSEENPTADLDLEPESSANSTLFPDPHPVMLIPGKTKLSEHPDFQAEVTPVYIYYSKYPGNYQLIANGPTHFTFFTSIDRDSEKAVNELTILYDMLTADKTGNTILESHKAAWRVLWAEGSIDVVGNLPEQIRLDKLIKGCFYYILSSIPLHSYDDKFYGLSPGGLAYGDFLKDYQGHSFWDTETWMYPGVLYFFPTLAQTILNYRLHVLDGARQRANTTGYKGARFPWESGYTGTEVTPDCCPETRDYQIHNTGDIGFAIRQYIAATRDTKWLKELQPEYETTGCQLIKEIAEFWNSRSTFNPATNQTDINAVMCPDEDHWNVDNSVYTNVIAGYAIFFAKYAECLCGGEMEAIPDEWISTARTLRLPYDATMNYHPEFEGYFPKNPDNSDNMIKQADVVLLGFPLMYPMDASTRQNDLEIYEPLTRPNGPAMTWAMHTVGFLELGELEKAEAMFHKSYKPYMREPFKVWTEAQAPDFGAVNFITGMGGFLQEVVSGFGGLRLHQEKLEFRNPRPLPGSNGLKLNGINYLGNVLEIQVFASDVDLVSVTLRKANPEYPLVLSYTTGDGHPVSANLRKPGDTVPVNKASQSVITIYTLPTPCPLPEDIIGQNEYHAPPTEPTPVPSSSPTDGATTPFSSTSTGSGASTVTVQAFVVLTAVIAVIMRN